MVFIDVFFHGGICYDLHDLTSVKLMTFGGKKKDIVVCDCRLANIQYICSQTIGLSVHRDIPLTKLWKQIVIGEQVYTCMYWQYSSHRKLLKSTIILFGGKCGLARAGQLCPTGTEIFPALCVFCGHILWRTELVLLAWLDRPQTTELIGCSAVQKTSATN